MSHNCLKIQKRDSDYIKGVSSPVAFKSVIPSGDWTQYDKFFERQSFGNFDTEGCVVFACQETIDAQIDQLIQSGQIDTATLTIFNQLGFMDSVNSLDGVAHFHSSARYLQSLTGNGFNGNALPDPFNAARKYGIIPFTLLPFDQTITEAEYLVSPMPQNLLDVGQKFLTAVGGKDFLQFHWIVNDAPTDTQAMDTAREQAPLVVAVLAEAPEWNQYEPPIVQGPPCHGVQNYNKNEIGELVLDHYVPFDKVLQTGYPINYVLQGVVNIVPPPPVLPPDPTKPQELTWLEKVSGWLQSLQERMFQSEKLGGMARSDKWPAFRKAFLKGKVCGVCGGVKKLEAHHILPFAKHPELELEVSNIFPLCEGNKELNCHLMFGHFDNFATKWNPDIAKDAAEWNKRFTAKQESDIM